MVEMHLKKKNNRYVITAATIFTLAIISASTMGAPAEATTATEAAATPPALSSGIELSPEPVPVYQERQITVSETPITQTHIQFTISGNGTLTLPNGLETINTTSTGSVIVSMDGTAAGKEVLSTEDGTENATATFFGIARFNMEDDTGRGIIIALVHTNSTGQLAPLDGMILAGQVDFLPDQTSLLTLWEWESGIPLPTTAITTTEEPSLINTTTTTTNATTATDTNAAAPEEEGGTEA
jgi:hypothetical protein